MKEEYKELKELQKRYLTRLSDLYPTIAAASTEIINLQAILNLPKGTEHFLTDVHGEYEAFSHTHRVHLSENVLFLFLMF